MSRYFTVQNDITRHYRRFNAEGRELTVRLNSPPQAGDPARHFADSVDEVFEYSLRDLAPNDMVGISIHNVDNQQDRPIGLSFRRRDQISREVLWSVFEKVTQSNARYQALDTLTFHVHSVRMPVGFGKAETSKGRSMSVMAHLKKSIVEVMTEENCLAHALVIAIAKVTNDPDYLAYRKGRKILPKVRELLQTSGVDLSRGGGIPELQAFQRHLSQYRIVVYSGLRCDNIMFDGQVTTSQRINLLYDGQHYHVITNLTAAMAKRYVCPACNKGCRRGEQHRCDASCDACTSIPPCIQDNARIPCDECNRYFRNTVCFENHKRLKVSGKTVCEVKRCCVECGAMKGSNHECHKRYCSNCLKNREFGHKCYMAPLSDRTPRSDRVLYIFYDFETTQDTKCGDDSFEHVPNLVCVQQFCSVCEDDSDMNVDCHRCGKRKHSFWTDPIGDLISYTFKSRPWADRVVAIAHNAKAFDLHFVLNRLVRMKLLPEHLILNGQKIMCLKVENVTWLDSVNYLAMPLRKLPEAFGLTSHKSWYPHLFNTAANMNYVGPAPDVSYYDIDHMHHVERKEFLVWYEAVAKKEVFDNRRVLESYCQADVTVLREACRTFRKHFLQIGNVEVFLESMTIASACNKVFRKKFLLPDRIGIIPVGGYTDKRRQSRKAIAWLLQEERRTGKKILHGRNGKERQLPELPNIHVDGLCEETRTVFEFNGCYFHGHTCQPFRDLPVACGGGTLAERYEQTMSRLERIAQAGYQIVVKWECEFEPPEDDDEEERLPLKTRDALYGGRTEAVRLHYRVREGKETIQYVDVMSLYPWVCKYFKFPVGHPTIHLDCGDIATMLAKEGLVRCTVLPPKDLYHPVLPYRCNGRLLFCLCRTCAESGSQEQCSHVIDSERALTATWVVDEVRVAIEHGYTVLKVHEFYEYEVTRYDPKTGEGGHFVGYIDTFLKLKAEASGYPSWVQGPEDEDRYVKYFRDSEDIELDKTAIQKNVAKRGLAKICLNSFWGKLTESSNRPQNKMIADPQELFRFLATPGIEVTNLLFAGDEVVWVTWKYVEEEENMPVLRHTNEVIGAYVTTGARLKLYTYLDSLRERVLYHDTDSVIYIQKSGEPPAVTCGDKLGDMTNELGSDEYISEFVSGGPKNYAYKVVNASTLETKTVCKVRGITLNYSAAQLVNFDSIKDMILGVDDRDVITVRTDKKIRRKTKEKCGVDTAVVVSEPEEKVYRISFHKRRRIDNFDSVPFGYVKE